MRIKVYLEVPKEVSVFYRRSILSFIKKVLEIEDKDYCEKIFSKGHFKPFTFCVFFGGINVNGEIIRNNGKAILTISSGSPDFFLRFYSGLKNFKEFKGRYINGTARILKREMIEEEPITSSKQIFRTLSPIVAVNREKHPILPEAFAVQKDNFIIFSDRDFKEELRYSLHNIFNGLPDLEFKHIEGKKSVVKHLVGNNNQEKVIKIVAYQGVFQLEADPYVLNEIYKYGIGFRRYQGFGCLEVVR